MQKIRVMVTCNQKVVRGGVALIINSAEYLEVVGNEGAEVVKEASELQPDLLVYELGSTEDDEYQVLKKLKEFCGWTKLIIFNSVTLSKEDLKRFMNICDGYLQGPILPGFLLKAVELSCYSGYFFFLGSSRGIQLETKEEVQRALPEDFTINRNNTIKFK
ncbi:MAG: response regulator transcription factor [Firmicutes bacterium]|nr:response regulator transcription factor [Bacillota bacterium]